MSFFDGLDDPFDTTKKATAAGAAVMDPFAADPVAAGQTGGVKPPKPVAPPTTAPAPAAQGWGNSFFEAQGGQGRSTVQGGAADDRSKWDANGAWVGNNSGSAPTAKASTPDFSGQVKALQAITDLRSKAVAQDKLARDTFSSLKAAGHDVKWSGQQLVVDGRPYDFAGGVSAGAPGGTGGAAGGGVTGNTNATVSPGAQKPDAFPNRFNNGSYNYAETNEGSIRMAYNVALGRDPSPAEIASHLGGGAFAEGDPRVQLSVNNIVNSPEAKAYLGSDSFKEGLYGPAPTGPGSREGLPYTADPAWDTDGYAAPASTMAAGSGAPPGWDGTKWADPNNQHPKYVVGRILSNFGADQSGFNAAVAEIQKAYPGTTTDGKDKVTIPGVGTIDIRLNAEKGGTGWAYQPLDGAGGDSAAPGPGGGFDANSAISSILTGQNQPTANATSAYGAQGASGSSAGAYPGDVASPYTPGAVAETPDLWQAPGGFTYDELFAKATPNTAVDTSMDDLINQILANPSTLDDRTVETMKAKSKDELAAMAETEDQDLQALGNQYGIDGSGWLAAARSGNKNTRDTKLIESNRGIDLTAAQTRNADRQAAAGLGTTYQGQRAGQQQTAAQLAQSGSLAAEGLKQSNAVARMNDMTTRVGLAESLQQTSAELGISQGKLAQDWSVAKLEDLSRRYGIDVGAQIDRLKLGQNDQQFYANLAFQIDAFDKELSQKDAQFGANYGLDVSTLQWMMDQYGLSNI